MALVWGVLNAGNAEDGDMRRRAAMLIQELEEEDPSPDFMVSAVTVAELLTHLPESQRGDFIVTLTRNFEVAPLDTKSTARAARLYDLHENKRKVGIPHDRQLFRCDTLIVGTLAAAGANVFYSHDGRARTIAQSVGMDARDLPEFAEKFDFGV